MTLETLLSLKSLVPMVAYVIRYVMESTMIDKNLLHRIWKTGPDLSYMAAILSSFNLVHDGSEFRQSITNHAYAASYMVIYGGACIILWILCVHFYRKMREVKSDTNKAFLFKSGNFVASFFIGAVLLIVALKYQ